tara:strand:- start:345 stop:668 length:324 start_codon:yes stop_codon:yes gene_type:complete
MSDKSLLEYAQSVSKGAVNMKPAKKRPSKRNANLSGGNPIIEKLLQLKYRINDAYRSGNYDDAYNDTQADKSYVMSLITDIRKHKFTKLAPEDGHCCNGLWRKYEGK